MIHIVRKSTPGFTGFLSLVLIRLVFNEIQPFENVKLNKQRNVWQSGRCPTRTTKLRNLVNLGVLFLAK